ncbi:hypothetical protein GCM10010981_47630 [Dyella nitratireducens]|uniref:Uncharacterized protein n=1 Tax=Dyella nitratireducens TaxID=1849580 RepID=A0ABQ1GXY0_9GAMM|nr:hypothetical protein GCM10010981_47630 [Dyella nitratireducens]
MTVGLALQQAKLASLSSRCPFRFNRLASSKAITQSFDFDHYPLASSLWIERMMPTRKFEGTGLESAFTQNAPQDRGDLLLRLISS